MKRFIALAGILLFTIPGAFVVYTIDTKARITEYFIDLCCSTGSLPPRQFIRFGQDRPIHYGFIDTHGTLVIPAKYESVSTFHEGLCAVSFDSKCGYINRRDELVIPAQFTKARDFSEGLAAVKPSGYWGYIDKNGKFAIAPSSFNDASDFSNGKADVRVGFKRGIIDRHGAFVVNPEFDRIEEVKEHTRRTERQGLYGFIQDDGRTITEPKFEHAADFSEGLAAVAVGGKWGYIDKSGKFAIEPTFEKAGQFQDGLAVAGCNGCFGLIDHSGQFVIKPHYKRLLSVMHASTPEFKACSYGLIPIAYGGHWGFASTATGRITIPAQYADVGTFSEQLASVGILDQHQLKPSDK